MTLPHSIALRSRVPAHADGATLLDYLLQRFPYHDRATWLGEIAGGRLLVGERAGRAEHVLRRGAVVTYLKEHREPIVDADIRVMHDDDAIVVAEKPAHLPMHADGPFVRNTFIHVLRTTLASPALQLVHRLDRETSGLCVVPRTRAARIALQDQFRTGTVQKTYVAVVHGRVERDFACEQPIGLAASSAIALRRTALPEAIEPRPACTRFEVLKRGEARTMLRCVPKTGRTHQIRVHLEAAGFPLLGDKLYGRSDADYLAFVASVKAGGDARDVPANQPDRHLLHASELCFDHPRTGRRLAFSSAPPAIFEAWLERS
ncbi:MAG TPA: RluA family pseudouridine synthase [Planctomycetota bacterium]|nr:RluA family pseudouridine synthase [Planctomycetota bacterium]